MGAWGPGVFENDGALDWADGFADASTLTRTLDAACVAASAYLDADDGSAALAAAAVVARWHAPSSTDALPEQLEAWVVGRTEPPDAELVARAVEAVERVNAERSELASLWGVHPKRKAIIDDLRARLT